MTAEDVALKAAERFRNNYTVTFLGCGNLGTAILNGIVTSIAKNGLPSEGPKPTKFIACVRTKSSADRVKSVLGANIHNVAVVMSGNVEAVRTADMVILGCKPFVFRELLAEPGLAEALAGKLLVSILAGIPIDLIVSAVGASELLRPSFVPIRVMPSVAARVQQSMTVIQTPEKPLPEEIDNVLTWLFSQVGKVARLPAKTMDAVTSLCGSGPAFAALMLEGLADGAVAMGVPRAEATMMAAQTMKGAAELVLAGEHPAVLREKVSTPGGCTIAGSLILEEAGVRGKVARAVRESTTVASQLGSGVKNVNGTRF